MRFDRERVEGREGEREEEDKILTVEQFRLVSTSKREGRGGGVGGAGDRVGSGGRKRFSVGADESRKAEAEDVVGTTKGERSLQYLREEGGEQWGVGWTDVSKIGKSSNIEAAVPA
jgi:hypothetical protein